jgi:hypothetical protein
MADLCPICSQALSKYPDYYYCYKCSKQFKKKMFGGFKEVPNTLQADQRKAMNERK